LVLLMMKAWLYIYIGLNLAQK